jgi:hypothetical protein
MKIAHLVNSQPKAPEEEVPLEEVAVAATEEDSGWYDYVQKLLLRWAKNVPKAVLFALWVVAWLACFLTATFYYCTLKTLFLLFPSMKHAVTGVVAMSE